MSFPRCTDDSSRRRLITYCLAFGLVLGAVTQGNAQPTRQNPGDFAYTSSILTAFWAFCKQYHSLQEHEFEAFHDQLMNYGHRLGGDEFIGMLSLELTRRAREIKSLGMDRWCKQTNDTFPEQYRELFFSRPKG